MADLVYKVVSQPTWTLNHVAEASCAIDYLALAQVWAPKAPIIMLRKHGLAVPTPAAKAESRT